ncbi:protein of unknown function [Pseudomonas mediterranea]
MYDATRTDVIHNFEQPPLVHPYMGLIENNMNPSILAIAIKEPAHAPPQFLSETSR